MATTVAIALTHLQMYVRATVLFSAADPLEDPHDRTSKLNNYKHHFISHTPAFLGPSNSIFNENLVDRFSTRAQTDMFDSHERHALAFFAASDAIINGNLVEHSSTEVCEFNGGEHHFFALAFFATSNGIINENLVEQVSNTIRVAEPRRVLFRITHLIRPSPPTVTADWTHGYM